MALDITATSARIQWTIPFIISTQETYYVSYGLLPDALTLQSTPQFSGSNVTVTYFQFLMGLDPADTYYFRIISTNADGETGSDLGSFTTSSGRKQNDIVCTILYYVLSTNAAPSAPPTNFEVAVTGTTMVFSWSPPAVMQQNGEIILYTLTCMQTAGNLVTATTTDLQFTIDTYIPGATFQCSVLATNAIGDGPSAELTLKTESKALLIDFKL